jgi:hypothetical protein
VQLQVVQWHQWNAAVAEAAYSKGQQLFFTSLMVLLFTGAWSEIATLTCAYSHDTVVTPDNRVGITHSQAVSHVVGILVH